MQCDCTLDPGQIMAVTQTSLYAEYGYVHFTVRELRQYLNNCTPTPPLIQPQSTDNKLGLMLG